MNAHFLAGLVAGILLALGGVGILVFILLPRLFETHRQALAQALSSERVLHQANDPARPRREPPRPKTDFERVMEARQEMERWERQMFGEEPGATL